MAEIWMITHGQVTRDPAVPVPQWPLTPEGRTRHGRLNARLVAEGFGSLWSSPEQKARDAAEIHGTALGLVPGVREGLSENDRSSTGFLPPHQFEAAADAFFGAPDVSWNGWETAAAAQARILRTVRAIDAEAVPGNVLICGHGAVTALTLCHAMGVPISRQWDQPGGGGGNVIRLRRGDLGLLAGWTSIEDLAVA
ncbi:phosphoglycerate mutase [Jannaschia pagri]|uniref:Phosphoglycerate mutase n=1 Tax=Jannaschia pagri TaxID=2829797 RepID=A0ABQ4NPT2_9RHOB|nr:MULTISPECIES: histidine phosphatase family protein [unclassified Jannaschia]GIT92714.1 phosphoglycerate mutase [Jannaschia sp. AI_61]GIT96426.1 phosphoglycerate mutase [Jannaschia sp. AI_62]